MDPADLMAARLNRWSIATTEVCAALRQLRACLEELGVDDPRGDALVEALRITEARATPLQGELPQPDDGSDDPPLVIVNR